MNKQVLPVAIAMACLLVLIVVPPAYVHPDPPGTGTLLEVSLSSITYTEPGDGDDGDLKTTVSVYHSGHGTGSGGDSSQNQNRRAGTYYYNQNMYSHFECDPASDLIVTVQAKDYDSWLRSGDDTGSGSATFVNPGTGGYDISFSGDVSGSVRIYILRSETEGEGGCDPQESQPDYYASIIELLFKILEKTYWLPITPIGPGQQFSMTARVRDFASEQSDRCSFAVAAPRLAPVASPESRRGAKFVEPIQAADPAWFANRTSGEFSVGELGRNQVVLRGRIPANVRPGLYAFRVDLRCNQARGRAYASKLGLIRVTR